MKLTSHGLYRYRCVGLRDLGSGYGRLRFDGVSVTKLGANMVLANGTRAQKQEFAEDEEDAESTATHI